MAGSSWMALVPLRPLPRVSSHHVSSGWRWLRPGPWLACVMFRGTSLSWGPVHDSAWQRGEWWQSQAWEFPTIENVTWTLIYQSQPITFCPQEKRVWRTGWELIARHDFQYFYQRWTLFLWAPLNWNNLRLGKTLRRCEPLIRGLWINSENFKKLLVLRSSGSQLLMAVRGRVKGIGSN